VSNAASPNENLGGALAGTGSSGTEALIGLLSGVAFGMVSPVVGHPFDLIKTKMQGMACHRDATVLQTVRGVYGSEGVRGFYRGFVPPFVASICFRSAQFSAYSGAYAGCSHYPVLNQPIPYTAGLRPDVVVGAMAAALSRALIETPLEFAKVRIMVSPGHPSKGSAKNAANGVTTSSSIWREIRAASRTSSPLAAIGHMYSGFTPTLLRSMGLLGSFFVMVDYSLRFLPDVMNAPLVGPFFKGGVCATLSWAFCFPFETAKSVIQADSTGTYRNVRFATWVVIGQLYRDRGISKGLYRGFLPGAGRSFFANGVSMLVYSW